MNEAPTAEALHLMSVPQLREVAALAADKLDACWDDEACDYVGGDKWALAEAVALDLIAARG